MNEPKIDCEYKSLSKFKYEALYHDYLNFYNLHKSIYDSKNFQAEMQSEKITLCEINASLWDKAISSATNCITRNTYFHYIIAQKFINYLLNASSSENFGLIENCFWKLLLTHPPSSEMFDYYSHILFDHFVCLNGKNIENQPLYTWLLETILSCLKVDGNQNSRQPTIRSELSNSTVQLSDFNKLPVEEKIKRCFIILNFVYKILETDFISWLHSNEFKQPTDNNRPLLSMLLWKNHRDFGSVNKDVQILFWLYKQAMYLDFHSNHVIEKLLTLVGEIIRWSDSFVEEKYPFVGRNSVNFSRELSLVVHYRLIETKNNLAENELIIKFKLPWLQLFLCSQLLTLLTTQQCLPELTGPYDILEYIAINQNIDIKNTPVKSSSTKKLIQKRLKFENVNEKLKNGKTHLHIACENNDIGKVKMLLTFPELDVNAVDKNGWTSLHQAAYEGKTAIVQELLSFSPKPGGAYRAVNTRARGPESTTPLMCAARQGHVKICKLLLEHSGSALLEDVNNFNQTAMEITTASAVIRILKYYKNNNICTKNNSEGISFDSNFKKIIIRLCIEMIQAYFSTYKTREIYKGLTKSEKTGVDVEFNCDYLPYDKDIKTNINKLKSLISKLEIVDEFKNLADIYSIIFSLHKTFK